jgi:hypothetical protein
MRTATDIFALFSISPAQPVSAFFANARSRICELSPGIESRLAAARSLCG